MGCKSSTYSHSWHMNQSVSVHWSASSRVMCCSWLHPQQDTSTVCSLRSSVSNPPKCWSIRSIMFSLFILFISLFFLSLTEDSLTENPVDCKLYFHFFSLFFVRLSGQIKRSWHGSCQLRGPPTPCGCPPVFSKKTAHALLNSVGRALFSISPTFLIHFNLSSKAKKNRTQLNPTQNTQVERKKNMVKFLPKE